MLFITNRVKRDFLDSCAQIRKGSLRLTTPEGEVHDFGSGAPAADMVLFDWAAVSAMAARGDIGLGETYIEGMWETSSIETLIQVAILNLDYLTDFAYPSFWSGLKFRAVDKILRANSIRGSARNIKAHYDVGNEFYQLWLDSGMTYSSALFAPGDNDLERAQNRKYDRVLNRLTRGERVLEIGCGWGGFAERAADAGRDVTGLTISPSQHGYADARLDGRASIELCDYRKSTGTYDNIVSIEMIEAVGERYWPSYFQTVKARLAQGGKAVIQAITVQDSYFDIYRNSSDYIRQYTFPGGMLLSDAVIAHQARQAGLQVTNSFAFGQDYARTCRTWAEQLAKRAPRIMELGYDAAFLRNWRYYLEICAGSFAVGQTDVVQVELTHA
ncbi:cyclopropane-fatty-acyl-phospholipid synthase [Phaeobacter gallaeciensis]|uniref:SAM-dependent methyltransferase n=1 Tax=Phaeobacter gallaeciensis TaxID=60890 RepID=UPI002380A243|nr:cyclopropane-fatty-acyl-phospholipid synthase family protein [Phaeobacter gallaeciensis]MDE4273781.1 cyclopropane-fatty-acyl-phospholipid synthase [Phaeobacter gallaeciensis]MDE4299021.1 cyclopropane-fatty-acyl-phospholipid synthase [Phaeobacter gallaeciensis]MDE5183767.1 cyclopropane-fatty-acyl-phospholipid synthase [Phaeobacter gallaeciensis]